LLEGHFNLGLVRFQQGRMDDAITSLNKSIALKPALRGANLFLGIARYRENDFSNALLSLNREIHLDPKKCGWFYVEGRGPTGGRENC
jgi:cytochrome c-type biogenesis protein CcmH/NrfG